MMTSSPPTVKQALAQLRVGEKESAITILRRIVQQEPENTLALVWLGGLTPDLEEGIAALEQALHFDPDNEIVQKGLADLKARKEAQQSSTPTEKVVAAGEILALASEVVWPFKGLKRPLGELIAGGAVSSRDLGWAARNAHDPTVKWAAAVQTRAKDVRAMHISCQQARETIWPFRGLNRPVGDLLAEEVISLHDLAYAVLNARDADVRGAAAVLGAVIVGRDGSSPESAETREAHTPSSPRGGERTSEASTGRLRIVVGSTYLVEQTERKARQRTRLGWGLVGLTFVAMVFAGVSLILMIQRAGQLSVGWILMGLFLTIIAWSFVPQLNELLSEQRNFVSGRKGEKRIARFLFRHLDDRWTLFRNVELPDNYGDIDGVLVGPRGVFALEVKAYTGYNRNVGSKWYRKYYGFWRPLDRNSSKQAKRNAARLGEFLKRFDADVWVEPRVVWSGDGKLWLERPAVRIWQLQEPAYMLEDIEKGKRISPEIIGKVEKFLIFMQRQASTNGRGSGGLPGANRHGASV